MATTFRLRVWTRFFASVEEVWALKTDGDHLRSEFPWFAPFRVDDEERLRAAFEACEPCEVDGRFGPAGLSWPLRLEAVERCVRYRDTSENVLYSRFEHEHLFEAASDGCRYIDEVTFTPNGPAQKAVALSTLWVFRHRHRVTARKLPADTRTVGTGILRVLVEDSWED